MPKDRYTGRVAKNYDYSYTKLDEMPIGWKKKFGLRMCTAIRTNLTTEDALKRFNIEEFKEEYGALKVYTYGSTRIIERLLIPQFSKMSERTCCVCGADATKIAIVWTMPVCDKCANSKLPNSYVDIDYFYGDFNE